MKSKFPVKPPEQSAKPNAVNPFGQTLINELTKVAVNTVQAELKKYLMIEFEKYILPMALSKACERLEIRANDFLSTDGSGQGIEYEIKVKAIKEETSAN